MIGRGRPHIVEQDQRSGTWVKSSRSSAIGTSCVEVAMCDCTVAVRDSKSRMMRLRFDRSAWAMFMTRVAP